MRFAQDVDKAIHWTLEHLYRGGNDLLYFLHVVAERTFDVLGKEDFLPGDQGQAEWTSAICLIDTPW